MEHPVDVDSTRLSIGLCKNHCVLKQFRKLNNVNELFHH